MAKDGFDSVDPITSFVESWKGVILDPRGFFERLPVEGGLQGPTIFALVSLFLGGLEALVFSGFGFGLKGLVGLLLLGLVRLFVGSAIVVLVAQNLFGGRGDFEATFRVLAYSTAVGALIGIPIVKYFAALYGAYLTIVGLERAHALDATRAFLTLLAGALVALVLAYALGLTGLVARVNPLLR